MKKKREMWKIISVNLSKDTEQHQEVIVPEGARFLSMQVVEGELTLYFHANPDAPSVFGPIRRVFSVYKEGDEIVAPWDGFVFRGSVLDVIQVFGMAGRVEVWHLFENKSLAD